MPNKVYELELKEWKTLELGEGIPMFCRISVVLRNPPLVLKFKYDNPDNKMTLYGSFT